ncbi:Nn.00g037150.m01.CDS01 [Neocucurbitaria sp. VM-36]
MGRPRTPSNPPTTLMTTPTPSSQATTSPSRTSPRNPSNKFWVQEQQRRTFLYHLTQWSLSHDSSPHFQGKISLIPSSPLAPEIGLGKSVACILTDTTFSDARKTIVIRLFPPQVTQANKRRGLGRNRRHEAMDPFGSEVNFSEWQRGVFDDRKDDGSCEKLRQSKDATNGCYKLVVRCGAGWISAREYFSKLYFNHLDVQRTNPKTCNRFLDDSLKFRSGLLGPPPSPKITVTVRPLFHPFRRLPPELQEMILSMAAGHTRAYNLCYDPHLVHKNNRKAPSPISLSTMFRISKAINEHLVPFVYHSTDFHFGLTGFTNFLWQSGPINRPEIRRLTFHFGKLALLHCIRWLAPDPVFDLLEPPVVTNPPSLQYFWRCQIQDLVRELHLYSLTIDLRCIPSADVPMVAHILRSAFGSVERMLFIETDKRGSTTRVEATDERIERIKMAEEMSWRDMCTGYWERHRQHQYFFKWDLLRATTEEFEKRMEEDKKFFACAT